MGEFAVQVIPAIDLRGGKCVRLRQGDYGRETVFDDDPSAVARRWVDAGASRLHVVDLDGARAGERVNAAAVESVVKSGAAPVQLGGGVRSAETAVELVELGVDRVVFGTAAIEAPAEVRKAVGLLGAERVIVSVDARGGMVMTRGWTRAGDGRAVDLMASMWEVGVRRFMFTDVERDGTLSHPNFDSIAEVLASVSCPVIAAGGVSTIGDLSRLSSMGVEAAVTGLAIYSGALDLRRAILEIETLGKPRGVGC